MYFSPNIVRMIKWRRMRWAGHVLYRGRGVYRVLVGKPVERDHLEELGVNGMIILRRIFRKWDLRAWTESMLLRTGTGGGHLWMR